MVLNKTNDFQKFCSCLKIFFTWIKISVDVVEKYFCHVRKLFSGLRKNFERFDELELGREESTHLERRRVQVGVIADDGVDVDDDDDRGDAQKRRK